MVDEGRQKKQLLDLPTELLDIVCEFAVVEDDYIMITQDLKQPALAQTCRRFRELALPIWYMTNRFDHDFRNFDRSLGIKFARIAESKGLDVERRIYATPLGADALYNEELSFANLMMWAKDHYERGEVFKYEEQFIGLRKGRDEDGLAIYIEEPIGRWFVFLYADWRCEWLRAGMNRDKMVGWEAKRPAIEAALRMLDISELCW